ncbi:MAG: hypothetical protein MK214_15675 [Thalassotalea sp.]|nr:hypothetical protein [Thalassotalea sp.]
MFKKIILITLFSLSFKSIASGSIVSLKVDQNTVYFSTDEAKLNSSPSCVTPENSAFWTVSLESASGKAIYALLVTAAADNRQISIDSAEDCSNAAGFERASSVELGASSIEVYTPKLQDVAYGYRHYYQGSQSCTIHINSKNSEGNYYLVANDQPNGTSCQCTNGSAKTVTQGGNNSASYYFKCVAAVE